MCKPASDVSFLRDFLIFIHFSLNSHVFSFDCSDVKQANKREGEFYNSGYIDYTISTICNHPAFPAGYFTVERRFSDFVW